LHDTEKAGALGKAQWHFKSRPFDLYDFNQTGKVPLSDFVYCEALRHHFHEITNGSKTITLKHWLKHHKHTSEGGKLTKRDKEELEASFAEHDLDKDGEISMEDWLKFLRCPDLSERLYEEQLGIVHRYVHSCTGELEALGKRIEKWRNGPVDRESEVLQDATRQLQKLLQSAPKPSGKADHTYEEHRKAERIRNRRAEVTQETFMEQHRTGVMRDLRQRMTGVAIALAYAALLERSIEIMSEHTNYGVDVTDCKSRWANRTGMTCTLWVLTILIAIIFFFIKVAIVGYDDAAPATGDGKRTPPAEEEEEGPAGEPQHLAEEAQLDGENDSRFEVNPIAKMDPEQPFDRVVELQDPPVPSNEGRRSSRHRERRERPSRHAAQGTNDTIAEDIMSPKTRELNQGITAAFEDGQGGLAVVSDYNPAAASQSDNRELFEDGMELKSPNSRHIISL